MDDAAFLVTTGLRKSYVMGKRTLEYSSVGRVGSRIFHRNPQVHRKWLCCEALDFANNFADGLRLQAVRAERSESPVVRNSGRKPPRGQASERPLNDRVSQPHARSQSVFGARI